MNKMIERKLLTRKIGLTAVIEELNLQIPLPAVRSTVASGARKTRIEGNAVYEQYPKTYANENLSKIFG